MNYSKIAAACDAGHPLHQAKKDTRLVTPHHADPTNYTSRNDWQRALWKSKIDPDSKRYIKSLENLATANWEETFESLWKTIEEVLARGLPITDDVLLTYITDSSRKQLRSLDREAWDSAFNGLFTSAREQSYKLTGYGGEKRRVGQVVDTLEEQAVLARLRQTALEKVRSITDEDLKAAILEALSKPGAYAENPVAIANRIVSEERKRLKQSTEDRETLREQIKVLYENTAWKIERITRTEAANAYWLSVLTGYREQGIERFTFNSHSAEQRTCAICLALDGTEHDVADWLSAGRYPLSSKTHPQCRCVRSDTVIETEHGSMRIAEITPGTRVKTHTGQYHQVTHVFRSHKRHSDRSSIKVFKLNGVVLTGDHLVLILDDSGTQVWKRVDELQPGKDRLCIL